jgi:hypothetical protein
MNARESDSKAFRTRNGGRGIGNARNGKAVKPDRCDTGDTAWYDRNDHDTLIESLLTIVSNRLID